MRNLVFAMVLAVGCGSSSDNGPAGGAATRTDIDDSCAQSCAAQKKCSSTVDETTCVNKCKNDTATYGEKVRADYVALINSCVASASCDKLGQCDDTAKASISPTAVVQSFCDDLLKKHAECRWPDTNKARCLENFKIFADTAIDQARTCLTKTCQDYGGCVLSTLGVRL